MKPLLISLFITIVMYITRIMPAGHSASQPFVDARKATFQSVILCLQLFILGWLSAFGAQWSSSIPRGGACMTYINSTEQVDVITIFPGVFWFSKSVFFIQCSNSPANVYNLKKNTLIWISSDYLRDVMRLRRDEPKSCRDRWRKFTPGLGAPKWSIFVGVVRRLVLRRHATDSHKSGF